MVWIRVLVVVLMLAIAGTAWRLSAQGHGVAERRQAIADCEGAGGIPVVIAGEISSRGIGCAAPLGN